ncbi:MAG: hypothetical protein WDO71_27765 [Bacteroidota bacterium]
MNETAVYCSQIMSTREINYAARKDMNALYHHDDGKLFGKGATKNNGETLIGNWEFYYSPGNLRSKGNYNTNGEKNGPWQYYHFNGLLKGKQTYKNNKLEDAEIFYYDNGALSTSATFKDDVEDGETKSYFRIGIPRTIAHYKAGKTEWRAQSIFQQYQSADTGKLQGRFLTRPLQNVLQIG